MNDLPDNPPFSFAFLLRLWQTALISPRPRRPPLKESTLQPFCEGHGNLEKVSTPSPTPTAAAAAAYPLQSVRIIHALTYLSTTTPPPPPKPGSCCAFSVRGLVGSADRQTRASGLTLSLSLSLSLYFFFLKKDLDESGGPASTFTPPAPICWKQTARKNRWG